MGGPNPQLDYKCESVDKLLPTQKIIIRGKFTK